jgi:two-component system cell cycle sensor histidine kinase/response regulator CckA
VRPDPHSAHGGRGAAPKTPAKTAGTRAAAWQALRIGPDDPPGGPSKEAQFVLNVQAPVMAAVHGFSTALKGRPAPASTRILVVDDEEAVLKFVNRILTERGYETVLASSGAAAEQAVTTSGPFNILVTDLMMPEMSGDELARRLRQVEPRLKVLYLTGFSDHLFKEKATLWADEAFLDKPCSVKGLLEAVSLLATGRITGPDDHSA